MAGAPGGSIFPEDLDLNGMSPSLLSAALLFSVVATNACRGARDLIIAWLGAGVSSLLLSFAIQISTRNLLVLFHVVFLSRQPCLRAAISNLRRAITHDGPDDENISDFFTATLGLLCYISTIFICVNLSTVAAFLWACVPSIGLCTVFVWILMDDSLRLAARELIRCLVLLRILAIFLLECCKILIFLPIRFIKLSYGKYDKLSVRILGDRKLSHSGRAYKYKKLVNSRDIRLLRIARKWPSHQVACEIIHESLERPREYEAVSYTWGTLPMNQELVVDGDVLLVTERVLEIVEARASYLDERVLWIDSVCIHQGDLNEKAAQVTLMRDIFRSAKRVVVWLGTAPDATECMHYIAHINRRLQSNLDDMDRKHILGIGSNKPGWPAFLNFLDHDYWWRSWIIQEIAVAKNVVVSYGGEYVSWRYLETLFHGLYSRNTGSPFILSETKVVPKTLGPLGAPQIRLLGDVRAQYHANELGLPLVGLLDISKACKATDPRDKIYSLLGLSTAINDPLLKPDYEKSTIQICIDTARHCIDLDPPMTLAPAGIGYKGRIPSLPSWVPDYTYNKRIADLSIHKGRAMNEMPYRASGNIELSYALHATLPILTVHALFFDSISHLGPPSVPSTEPIGSRLDAIETAKTVGRSLLAVYDFATETLGGGHLQNGNESQDEAIWRTLIGDRLVTSSSTTRPAPQVYGEHYKDSLRLARYSVRGADANDPIRVTESAWHHGTGPFVSEEVGLGKFAAASASVGSGRRTAITRSGTMSLVPEGAIEGDILAIFKGGQTCVALRREIGVGSWTSTHLKDETLDGKPINAEWRFVGECYVHGFMDGEAITAKRTWEKIYIW